MAWKAIIAAMLLAVPALAETRYGGIDGNVPSVQYDNVNRTYTQVVLPEGYQSDALSAKVVQAFAGDPTVRQTSIVKLNAADGQFVERWGRSFEEAQRGYPTACIIRECGDKAASVWKWPMGSTSDVDKALSSCRSKLASLATYGREDCPNCPKLNPFKPKHPDAPAQPTQPTLPPLPNTPGPGPVTDDIDYGQMALICAICGFIGWAVVFKRGMS